MFLKFTPAKFFHSFSITRDGLVYAKSLKYYKNYAFTFLFSILKYLDSNNLYHKYRRIVKMYKIE